MPTKLLLKKINSDFRGFTLVEIIVGITLIGLILLVISNLPYSIRLVGQSKQQSVAKEIASTIVENLRSKTYDNLANTNPGSPIIFSDPRTGQLPSGVASYTINDCPITICKSNPKELTKLVKATVIWKNFDKDETVEISTLVSKGGLY